MENEQEILKVANQFHPANLPVAYYVVAKDGTLIECNDQFREILEIPLERRLQSCNIKDYYQNVQQRDKFQNQLAEAEQTGSWLKKCTIPFKTAKGREIFVQDHCKSFRNAEGEILGYTGCLIDITEEENYHRLFDRLPAGVYQLDKNDNIVRINKSVALMLGYECEEDLLGINIAELYFDRKNEIEFREMLIRDKKVTNSKVKLKKKNNEAIYVSVNSFVIEDANGKYDGREGTITDVTNEEYFRRILEDTPIGLYELKLDGEKDVITRCNRQFQDLFEFNEGESAIDFNSRDSTDYVGGKYNEMIQKLIELDKEGQKPLRNFYLPIITRRGNKKTIEVNTRFEHDAEGKIIGRIGGLVDVTDEVKFRERVRELTVDIGSVLHAYSSTLVMLGLTIEFIIEALGPDPMKDLKNMSPEQEMEIIREPANALLTSLQRMIYSFTPDNRRTDVYTRLFHLADILKSLNTEIPNLEFRLPTVEEIAQEIASLCNTIDGPELVEKAKNEVLSFNEELLRLCNLIELHRADKEIIAMGHQVSTLREYVLYDTRTKEPRTFVKIRSLIGQAVNKMDRYLKYEKMDVKFKIDNGDTEVPVVERDIIRAIGNLLHNAIKYSWQRAEQLNRWITVASQVEGGFLVIEIEDYGLAVPRDEIENDILFKIGSRGRQSIDRGRVGTGVGLADARRVARDHGGDVTLKSHPFKQHGNPNDYSQPFITTAIIKLPLMEIFQ